jgi:ribosomal protein S18 acetylase RimI-like enzyme
MISLTLRRAVPADAARLSLLGGATFLTSFAHDHPGDAIVAHVADYHSAEWYERLLADPDSAAWILETDLKAPVGYALLTPPAVDCPTDPDDLELKRIYLLAPFQSGGWGVKLIEAVEAEARARRAKQLYLCVYSVNHAAQRFYARQGFADTGHKQNFRVGDVEYEDLIWVKPLA